MPVREIQAKSIYSAEKACYNIQNNMQYGAVCSFKLGLGDFVQKFITKSYGETCALGERLGKALRGGRVIAFFGGMGMGKTAFVTGVAKGMGISDFVSSPTFSIVNVYGKNAELCHFDMYRVESWEDLDSTGFFEYMENGSVLCVEWSENIENALPADAVRISIAQGEEADTRIIMIDGLETVL